MPRLDVQTRERVMFLKQQGFTYKNIQQRFKEEGITITIKTLYLLVSKYNQTGSVSDQS